MATQPARTLSHLGIGSKLSLAIFLIVGIIFGLFILMISTVLSRTVESRANAEVADKTALIVTMVETVDRDLQARLDESVKIFARGLPKGTFALDATRLEIASKPVPNLTLAGKSVNLDFSEVDRFTANTGAVATLFAKDGEDFVRVTTSVHNDKGARAVGTKLDRAHPGYQAVMHGESYVGPATLFGRQYLTRYDPVRDTAGTLIGVSFVGLDYTSFAASLKNTIRALKIGKTGYFYVLDARPGPNLGNLIVHPVAEGTNILDSRDNDGHEFIKDILERKNGLIRYPWVNKNLDESVVRDKVVAFSYMKNWNWVLAGGTYVDEYTAEVRQLRDLCMLSGMALVLLISGLLYFLIRKLVTRPLGLVTAAAEALADNDLRVALQNDRRDEIGRLMQSMNHIGSSLTSVVSNVRRGAETVASASREIAHGNSDLSVRTEEQASALEKTAASVEQLTSTVKQNADNSRQANQLAIEASSAAAAGGAIVASVVATMAAINESSRRIADITGVIDSIAFQTNILALNAAVEAARAGEQGRGFAVVAAEVRNLAQRSAAAAGEIKGLIGASVDKVTTGSALVDRTGVTMQEIVERIAQVTTIMAEISAASVEQTTGIEEVNRAITDIDSTTQQNAALVEEAAAASEAMTDQATALQQMVSVFKIGDARDVAVV